MVKLQLALDLLDLKEALRIARLTKKWVDIVEAGTPLIKQNGLKAVERLRKRFPDRLVLADMKTADTGALEVEMAHRAGADITTIMGAAGRETLSKGIREARKLGIGVAVDTVGTSPREVLKKLRVRPDYLIVHRAIDRDRGSYGLEGLKARIPLAVAGGITARTAGRLARRAEIVIVGRAITAAEEPAEAARKIKEAIM